MTVLYVDRSMPDEARRHALYGGDIFVYSGSHATRALCELARELLVEAFAPHEPELAQYHLPVEQYAAVLADVKPRFIHHPDAKAHIRRMLQDYGCDPSRTYFDVPRLRTSTSDDYLTSGIAFAFHPHRDTWYSAPPSQINWWLPVYEVGPDNGLAIHPQYWSSGLRNGSRSYDYEQWKRTSRKEAAKHVKRDTRKQPTPEEEVELDPQLRPVSPVGGPILFSAAQLHSSVPNHSGRTRVSIDFRTVHIDDVIAGNGAPNVDSECTGTTLRDYLRASDLEPMSDEVARPYDGGPPPPLFSYDADRWRRSQ